MATKKATSKKSTSKSTSTKTASVKKPDAVKTVVKPAVAPKARGSRLASLPKNLVNIVFAELFATFALTLVALATFTEMGPLYVGLTVMALVIGVGAISGAHLNPAVTFGLWSINKLKGLLVPFYWGAQLLGAMLAVIVINLVSNNSLGLSFGHIWSMDWAIFGAELVGMTIFMFGLAAAVSRSDLTTGTRALTIGVALAIGLVTGTTVYSAVRTNAISQYQEKSQSSTEDRPEIPHSVYVKGVVLNPAVALAVVEHTEADLLSSSSNKDDATYSRFSAELVLGTLLGAAVGGNLYRFLVGRKNS